MAAGAVSIGTTAVRAVLPNRLMPASQPVLIEQLLLVPLLPLLLLLSCGTLAYAAATASPGRPCCSTCRVT
jgi:hypothetical protein